MFNNKHSIALDEVGVIPESPITYSDDDVDLSVEIGLSSPISMQIPIISAAMDSVFSRLVLKGVIGAGGMCLLNLCGLISRYKWDEFSKVFAQLLDDSSIETLQRIYAARSIDVNILRDNLKNVRTDSLSLVGVTATPQYAKQLFPIAQEFGFSVVVLQSSFISPFWQSAKHEGLNILKYTEQLHKENCIVMVGNVASLDVAIPFISAGIDAIIEGIGPGVICTTRKVLGIGAGHVSTISEMREYIERHQSPTRIIADGGISGSGDIVKLLCTGAHAVILGSLFARTIEAPFPRFHWGMSAFHKTLPRGNMCVYNDIADDTTVERVLFGPSRRDDGTLAIIPALKNALSNLGCRNIKDCYSRTSVIRFPSMSTEGKIRR